MLDMNYFKFYNELQDKTSTIEGTVIAFTNFIMENNPNICYGLGAVLENGSYRIVTTTNKLTNASLQTYPLQTHDIHLDIYDLKPIHIGNEQQNDGFLFISKTNHSELMNFIIPDCQPNSSYICLNIFHKDYLMCQFVFVTNSTKEALENDLIDFHFLRNNIQSMLYPIYSNEETDNTNLLIDTAESIISSKQYLSSDYAGFMSRLLELAFETLDEPDYGSALLFENGQWSYVHAIGHDLNALSNIQLPEKIYSDSRSFWENYREVSPNIYIIGQILDIKKNSDTNSSMDLFSQISKASKPIKETIQLHIYFNGVMKGIISLDKKRDSNKVFTRRTINVLKRLNFLGQILFTYATLNTNRQSFEKLTNLISKLVTSPSSSETSFLHDFLLLLIDSLYEADYASAYIRDKNGIHFLDAIGHDLKALQQIDFKPHYFVEHDEITTSSIPYSNENRNSDNEISATLFSDIQDVAKDRMPKPIYDAYISASKPIKDGLISQSRLDEDVYMNISCDIKKGSQLSFSKDTIHLFTVLNNLGFAFISNEYYIKKYKSLNSELESKIKDRTKELKATNEKLRAIVNKDSLTGLFNHKSILKILEADLKRKRTLSIFLFDIDHFKEVNDAYGHQIGDEVLVNISDLVSQDKSIIAGRYGGEEFLLLLPNFDLPEAISYCQKLLSTIEATEFIPSRTITVSGGVVTNEKGTATEMIRVADTLLYDAKDSGRNQIKYNYC